MKKKILVIDDDLELAGITKIWLRKAGYNPLIAEVRSLRFNCGEFYLKPKQMVSMSRNTNSYADMGPILRLEKLC